MAVGREGGRAVLLLCLLTAIPAYRLIAQCPDGTPPPCARPATRPLRANGVAVRYLESLSRDTLDRDLAEGLTEEIIARLSQVPGLQVASRYATVRYRGRRTTEPAQVGRELGVRYVIDGTLRRIPAGVRIVLTMADASGGFNVWGQTFERSLEDVSSVQDTIAFHVTRAVRGPDATPTPLAARSRAPATNPDAYQAYLQGGVAIRARTAAAAGRSIAAYRRSIDHDSSFAPAWAGLAHVLALVRDWGWIVPGVAHDSVQTLAARAAARARSLDSNASGSWLAAAMVERLNDADRALAWHHRAVHLDSSNVEARHQLAWGLTNAGKLDSAIAIEREALRLDPYYAYAYAGLAQLYMTTGRPQDALTWVEQGLAVDSTLLALNWQLADAQLALGHTREARAAADRVRPMVGAVVYSVLRALIAVREGDTTGVRAALPALRDSVHNVGGPTGGLAFTLTMTLSGLSAQVGDAAGAIEEGRRLIAWPRRYYRIGFSRHWYWEPIRADPRFQAFVAGLAR